MQDRVLIILKGQSSGKDYIQNLLAEGPKAVLCAGGNSSHKRMVNRIKVAMSAQCSPIVVTSVVDYLKLVDFKKIAAHTGYSVMVVDVCSP